MRSSLALRAYDFHFFIFKMDPSGSESFTGQSSSFGIFEDEAIVWWYSASMFVCFCGLSILLCMPLVTSAGRCHIGVLLGCNSNHYWFYSFGSTIWSWQRHYLRYPHQNLSEHCNVTKSLIAIIGTMQNVNMDILMLHNRATTERGRMLLLYIMVDKVVSAEDLSEKSKWDVNDTE